MIASSTPEMDTEDYFDDFGGWTIAILEFQMIFFVFHRIARRCHLCSSHQWRGVMVKALRRSEPRAIDFVMTVAGCPGLEPLKFHVARIYTVCFFSTVFYFSIFKWTMGLQPANIKQPLNGKLYIYYIYVELPCKTMVSGVCFMLGGRDFIFGCAVWTPAMGRNCQVRSLTPDSQGVEQMGLAAGAN